MAWKTKFNFKILVFCLFGISSLLFPITSYAYTNPTLVRILNYYQDSDGRITFKWQQDYAGCAASGFDCSVGVGLSNLDFPFNGGDGFYNTDGDFGSSLVFTNFVTECNEVSMIDRICVSHPRALLNRNNNGYLASNNAGLLYSDVASYVNSGGQMHTILGGIFRFKLSATNHISFGDSELPYIAPPPSKTPVLIVPGLLGTEMKKNSELLWADIDRMFSSPSDSFLDYLNFNRENSPLDSAIYVSDMVHSQTFLGFNIFNYTDGLITEFQNQGYVENQTLFTFPYDWRYGVSGKYADGKTNSDLLAQKIYDILQQTGSDKVDVVAHSQGGLIVKKYVVDHVAGNHLGKVVFVGVPNTGAPFAIKVLLEGDHFGIPWLSENEIKKISENMPAAYDLLPSQQYYNSKGSFVKVIDEGQIGDLNNVYTDKDLTYSEFAGFITNDHGLNSIALTGAQALHANAFDNFDVRLAGVDVYAIDGCKAATMTKITENRFKNIFGQSFTEYKSPTFSPGDNTVPLESSTNLPINAVNKFYLLTADHSKMLSQDGSRQQIVNIISGSNLEVKDAFITQDIAKCNLNGKAISVFSPISILATDQAGNRTGMAQDGSLVNEIPNANFALMGEHKFLYLPTDDGQVYDVSIAGTGAGSYTIDSQSIVNNQVSGTEVFSNLPVTASLSGKINLGSQTTLSVKTTPQSPEITIMPSAVINPDQSNDVAPPISVATLSGTSGQAGYYRSDVKVAIKAQDQIIAGKENQASGILALEYNLDDVGYQKIDSDTTVLNIVSEGSHVVKFYAIDKAGNKELEKSVSFVIDKTAPEAVIQFDPAVLDMKFSGIDNLSSNPLVLDKDNVITISDQAGNTTELTLKNRNRKIIMAAEIASIKYNGVAANISANAMVYSWLTDKNKKLVALSQYVKSNKYNMLGLYDGKNTKFVGVDSSGIILKSIPGLKIIKISTKKGNFEWSY